MLYAAVIRLGSRRRKRWKFLPIDQHLDLGRVQNLALDQRLCNLLQRFAVVAENLLGSVVAVIDQLAHFLVNLDGSVFAVVAMLRDLAAQEDLLFLLAEGQRTE